MFEAFLSGITQLFAPMNLLMFTVGTLMGIFFGILPGLDGVTGLALLLPFTFMLDANAALALILGLSAISFTAGSITSILIGAPGTSGSTATIMDGFPMAKKGLAGKAIGTSITSSIIGGVFGAIALSLTIPIFRPLVLMFGSAEFLAMAILGISLVAVLGGDSPLKGIVSAGVGMLLAQIGQDPVLGLDRWTFNIPYLQQKISIALVALGLFALTEIMDMAIQGLQISKKQSAQGKKEGVKETFKQWRLTLSSSFIGATVGFMPGLGAAVACWIAYAWAVITGKPKDQFGKGDIRGVIAPESANNASLGGSLIPTIAFGIPGGTLMALLLSAFWMLGLRPGPDMLTRNLDTVYLIIWTVALSNIIGGLLLLRWTDQVAKIAMIRMEILAPIITLVIFLGAAVTNMNIWDLWAVFAFCILGWVMKQLDWPRPPLLMGFILGPLAERFYFTSMMVFGSKWLFRPAVMVILGLSVCFMIVGYRTVRSGRKTQHNAGGAEA